MHPTLKNIARPILRKIGYLKPPVIPDQSFYRPLFSPWLGFGEFAEVYARGKDATLVPPASCWILYSTLRQALNLPGEVWECGVYRGGTAAMMAPLVASAGRTFRLFDTFAGMPSTDHAVDVHRAGDFADTSLEAVRSVVNAPAIYHAGFMPDTFRGLEGSTIAFAHVDVDIKQSVLDCCMFIFPRLVPGGVMVFDDYGYPTCPGARAAVDEFFIGTKIVPLVLPTGQAVVFKPAD